MGGKGNQSEIMKWCNKQTEVQSSAPFSHSQRRESQKGLWWGRVALPGNATDHGVVWMDDVAFSFVMLNNSMVCREKAFSFTFTSMGKFLASSPSHTMENDTCPVFVHLAVLVNDSGCMPGVVDHRSSGGHLLELKLPILLTRGF